MTLLRRLWFRWLAISRPVRQVNHRPKAWRHGWRGGPYNRTWER